MTIELKSRKEAREKIRLLLKRQGIKLKGSQLVHHKDHNPLNNCFDNLQVMERSEHKNHHIKQKYGFLKHNKTLYQNGVLVSLL